MTKTSSVFAAVVELSDGIAALPTGYAHGPGSWPVRPNGEMACDSDGWGKAFVQVVSAVLRDMKVSRATSLPRHVADDPSPAGDDVKVCSVALT